MLKQWEERENFLVTGGSRGYGAVVSNTLRACGATVYTAQRTISPSDWEEDRQKFKEGFWKCDFEHAEAVIPLVQKFVKSKEKISGVVHMVALRETKNPKLLNTFDLVKHLQANVLNPLMLTVYLYQYGAMCSRSPVIWLLDRCKYPDELLAYTISKSSLPQIVGPILEKLTDLRNVYIIAPPSSQPGSDDIVSNAVVNVFSRENTAQVIDLR